MAVISGRHKSCTAVHEGGCTATCVHVGRADYFGLAVNRAARFLGAACGGQVLAERGLVEEVVQYWHSLVYKSASMAVLLPRIHKHTTSR